MITSTTSNLSSDQTLEEVSAVTIDCLVFGLVERKLMVLLVKHASGIVKDQWGLPGGWIHTNENLDDAASRLLQTLTGVDHTYLEQFKAFGRASRYPGKRVITVAYYALVKPEHYDIVAGFTASEVRWAAIEECQDLIFDHNEILTTGYKRLKSKIKLEPIGFNLLPKKFTLLQLQELYETILNITLDKSNFRRKILKMRLLVDCNEKQTNVAHRAANLYKFDKGRYEQLTSEGFVFDI